MLYLGRTAGWFGQECPLYPEVAATGGCAHLLQLIYLTVYSCAERSGEKKKKIASVLLTFWFAFIIFHLSL